MKLISGLSVALLMAAPLTAMANDTPAPDAQATESVVVTDVAQEVTEPTTVPGTDTKSPWYSGIELGVGVSATSGLNGFVGYTNKDSSWWIMRRLGLRLDFASTKPIASTIDKGFDSLIGDEGLEIEDVTINDVELNAKHIGAIVDFYPFGDTWFLGGWRLSGGYIKGDINVAANLTGDVDGLPAGDYGFSFGGVDYKYSSDGHIHGTAGIDWDFSGPYIGTGFDFGLFAGLKIYVDAGVVFTNHTAQIDVDIPTTGLQQNDGTGWKDVNSAELDAEIDRVLSDAQSELDDVDFYPMVKVGFMYRF